MPTPEGHRVIGIKHALEQLREGHGLLPRGIHYPDDASAHIKNRCAALRLVARAMKTGKLPPSLSAGIMGVRVGNETFLIEIAVPKTIRALDREHRE